MSKFIVPQKLYEQKIEILNLDNHTIQFLKNKNIETIEDIIDKQHEIPRKYSDDIKRIIMLKTYSMR